MRHSKANGKRPVHGFKAHVCADTALVEEVSITSANDSKAGPEALYVTSAHLAIRRVIVAETASFPVSVQLG
jgi:hypothetical protein